jgi:serine/threonine-protein kinase
LSLSAGGVVEGTPFGRYRFIGRLGVGGMGEVWKAFDTDTERIVAVKVLPALLAGDRIFKQRFRREAHAAAQLSEPHVVPIHNFGEIDGRLYVDMRLIEGDNLEHVLADGPMDAARSVKIIEQVASALNAAHRVGLVHRDVKPSNVLVSEDDFAYLIDFGIARGAGETGLTATGNVVGTWPYMAPERFVEGRSDIASDIYSLACVLYECLTSSRPFPGDSVEQQIAGHLTTPPPRPSVTRPGVSAQLDAVVAVGMAKDPGRRYATTVELARAARAAITPPAGKLEPSPGKPAVPASTPTQRAIPEDVDSPRAPTQARPLTDVDQSSAAQRGPANGRPKVVAPSNRGTPGVLAGTAASRQPWWRRKAVTIPAAVLLVLATVATVAVFVTGNESHPNQDAPLDGTFVADYGANTQPDGKPYENGQGGPETWVMKSSCREGDCVATASKVSGAQSTISTMILDQIGERWIAVSTTAGTCQNSPAEFWETMWLQGRPDGTVVGEFVVRSTQTCARNQQVTFTRTGDVQADVAIADPHNQPPLVTSPADALSGQYRETDTYRVGQKTENEFEIKTYCLRTAQRCLSYWFSPNQARSFTFKQQRWVLNTTSADSQCSAGGSARKQMTLEYPLPQPPQNPITLLSGSGHYAITGDCPFDSDFDSRVERSGD